MTRNELALGMMERLKAAIDSGIWTVTEATDSVDGIKISVCLRQELERPPAPMDPPSGPDIANPSPGSVSYCLASRPGCNGVSSRTLATGQTVCYVCAWPIL